MRRLCSVFIFFALVLVTLVLTVSPAQAIPAFARKYKLACNTCHTMYPQLNRFGRDFRDNGFRMPDEVETLLKRKSGTSDPAQPVPSHGGSDQAGNEDFWSFIPDQVPFSLQGKVHGIINPKGDVKTDVQFDELQLQAGGTMTPRVSYYLHHHLAEEGEPGDLYAAWVRFNNLVGSSWNVTVGQFELPLSFSPEIERLSSFEYLVYGQQLGANPFDLNTPQLGVTAFGQSQKGTKVWFGAANGFGLAVDESTETFDNNSFKDVYARVAQELGEHVIGGAVYYGRARGTSASGVFSDDFVRVSGDALANFGKFILYGTAVYGRDRDPLGTGARRSYTGGFAEGDVFLTDRTVLTARFDAVHVPLPTIVEAGDDEQGESGGAAAEDEVPFRVNTLAFTPGIQHLVRPNVKIGFEYQVRQNRREDRGIAELHFSF